MMHLEQSREFSYVSSRRLTLSEMNDDATCVLGCFRFAIRGKHLAELRSERVTPVKYDSIYAATYSDTIGRAFDSFRFHSTWPD